MMSHRSLGHRAPLLWLVLPFTAGLAFGKFSAVAAVDALLAAAAGSIAVTVWAAWRSRRIWETAMVVAMACAGAASYALHRARLPAWDALPPREARLTLRVDRIFNQVDPRRATGLGTIANARDHLRELGGQRVYFSLSLRKGEAAPIRSAVLSTVGVLVTLPRNPPADSFDGYLASAGINFRLTRGRVLAEERPANAYYRFCVRAAERCNRILGLGIAEKRPALAGLLRAMMLGATHELSDEQHTLFMQSGTMHLFAISGLNIGVIASALQALLLLLRLPLWARFAIGTALLWLFVDITGASPSAVRAFVMAVFLHAAFVFRRPANVLAGLVASAFAVLLLSPLQVFSASFLMSYAIVLALLVLGLPLGDAWLERWSPWRDLPKPAWAWWQRWIDAAWRTLAVALAIGLATTLVSLLTGVQFFRLLTPGALAANLALIPAAMVVTLGGFAALLCGFFGFTFGAVLCNHAAAVMLWIIEWLVRLSVRIPGAFVPAHYSAAWIGAAALTALMATLVFGYATNWKLNRGGWWPPFAVVAITLIFGVKFG
jgi:competence protein ComEC